MDTLPEPLQKLVARFARLPGFGPKSALRAAMVLLKWPADETRSFGESIARLRDELHLCDRCGALCESRLCHICTDPARQDDLLCVVPDWDSLLAIEAGRFFHGRYVILNGLISPLDNMPSDALEIDRLERILSEGRVTEVVFALGATVEADATASFIKARINAGFPGIQVTRLAQGIPLGQEVKSTDGETLRQALKYRQIL